MILTAFAICSAVAAAPPQNPERQLYPPVELKQISLVLVQSARPPGRRPPPLRGRRHLRLGPGGLRAHENRYGHCCRKHVGRTPQQMFARLRRERNRIRVSTFPNMRTAQRTVRKTLHQNAERLDRWGAAGNPGTIEIYGRFNYPIGTYVQRGSQRVRKAYRSYFLLVGNQHWPGGFQIITGYPVP